MGVSISWTFFLDFYCIYQVSVYTLQDNTMSKLIVSCKKCSALLILLLSEAANYSCMRGIHSPFTDAQLEMIATQIAQFRFTSRRAKNIKLLDSHFLARFVCLYLEMLAGWTNWVLCAVYCSNLLYSMLCIRGFALHLHYVRYYTADLTNPPCIVSLASFDFIFFHISKIITLP